MAAFRKKPIIVEAEQYTGKNEYPVGTFGGAFGVKKHPPVVPGIKFKQSGSDGCWFPFVNTKNGEVSVRTGDWIIREIDGSGYYPCSADAFTATYEPLPS